MRSFHYNWFSRSGSQRPDNQDCAGIAIKGDFLLAIIADGVSSRPQSGALANALTRYLVDRVILAKNVPTSADVNGWLRDAHNELGITLSLGAARCSYLVSCFAKTTVLYAINAGDCRFGTLDNHEAITWRTPVHSVATATGPLPESELFCHPLRNMLTRIFSTRRFTAPEITELNVPYTNGAILATDGFWAGLPFDIQSSACHHEWQYDGHCEDDVSRLVVSWDNNMPPPVKNAQNLYIRRA